MVATTVAAWNPHNAAADDGLLQRFAAASTEALSQCYSP